jgi:hypothetical protein
MIERRVLWRATTTFRRSLESFDCLIEPVTLCDEESDYLCGFHSTKFSTEFLADLVPKVSK